MKTPKVITTEELAKLEFNKTNFEKLKKQIDHLQKFVLYYEEITKKPVNVADILKLIKK